MPNIIKVQKEHTNRNFLEFGICYLELVVYLTHGTCLPAGLRFLKA
jgi:hypothetical protein